MILYEKRQGGGRCWGDDEDEFLNFVVFGHQKELLWVDLRSHEVADKVNVIGLVRCMACIGVLDPILMEKFLSPIEVAQNIHWGAVDGNMVCDMGVLWNNARVSFKLTPLQGDPYARGGERRGRG